MPAIKSVMINWEDGTSQEFVPKQVPAPNPVPTRRSNIGINTEFFTYWGTAVPVENLAELFSPWIGERDKWGDTPLSLDSNGGVVIPSGVKASRVFDFHPGLPAGEYVLRGDHLNAVTATLNGRPSGVAYTIAPTEIRVQHDGVSRSRLILSTKLSGVVLRTMQFAGLSLFGAYANKRSSFGYFRPMNSLRVNDPLGPSPTVFGRGISDRASARWVEEYQSSIGSTLWLPVHHEASDSVVRASFEELLAEGLDASKPIVVEHSNEVWNSAFAQGKLFIASDYVSRWRWHIERTTRIAAIAREVGFADVRAVVGAQAAASGQFALAVDKLGRSILGGVDAVAIAPYFGHRIGSPDNASSLIAGGLDAVFAMVDASLREAQGWTEKWVQTLKGLGDIKLFGYEGGQHIVMSPVIHKSPNEVPLLKLFTDAQRDPRMAKAYRDYLTMWDQVTGRSPLCLFSDCCAPNKWGAWGLMEHERDIEAPKWAAVQEYIKANP